ncbi:MAG: histidine phosphatase family protein [Aquificae bacterium]|nr:histidine phosphatase family protein [Aquificota bacterium]
MKRFYLIRHAQSEFNEKGIFQGRLDSDLTPLGFVQARLLAGRFKKEKPELIITSPQRRAYKTALTLSDVLGVSLVVDERLREMSFGVLEGNHFWTMFEENKEMILNWLKDPVKHPLPTQEDMGEFEKRISSLLEDLKRRKEKRVALVGHGGTLHALVCLALGIGLDKMWHIHMDNTGVSVLDWDGERFYLGVLNDTCHLNCLK